MLSECSQHDSRSYSGQMENNTVRGSKHTAMKKGMLLLRMKSMSMVMQLSVGLNSTSMSSDGQRAILFLFFGHFIVTKLLIMQNIYANLY